MRTPSVKRITMADVLDASGGTGRGFDFLRFSLSILILLSHISGLIGTTGAMNAILTSIFHIDAHIGSQLAQLNAAGVSAVEEGQRRLTGLSRPITLSYLPMFFALSGFLVTGSALRTKRLLPFLGLRVLRLLPALFVEVTLSAIVLGGIFTTLPLLTYYTSEGFLTYFLNILGDVHFYLPGVFEKTSQSSVVNGNLWTLPWELYCYILLSVIILSTMLNRRNCSPLRILGGG